MELENPTFPRDTLITPLIIMVENGVPISTMIDVGAADGTFGLTVLDAINAGIHLINLDAQDVYEPNLRRIVVDLHDEYARHVGHADLMREAIDGLVGEDPPQ